MSFPTGVGQGGGGVSGRSRRIDDVRHLQRERRMRPQPVPPPPPPPQRQQSQRQEQTQYQYEYDVDEMAAQMHHRPGGYPTDANTISSSTVSGGGRSGGGGVGGGAPPTSSTTMMSPATSTRSVQSRRKNMMQRRIEMRRMNEERLELEKMMPQQQQLLQRSQSDAPPSARQPQHSMSNNPYDGSAREANHYSQPDTHRPYQSQQKNHLMGPSVDQQHDWRDYNSNSDQNQERVAQVQHQDFPPQESQPQLQNHPDQSRNAQQSHQHPHRAQQQQSQQPYQSQQQSQHQYSMDQAAHLILLSPPVLQRTGEPRFYEAVGEGGDPSIEVIRRDGRDQYSFESEIPGETNNYQVYNESQLERSGIIRDSRPHLQPCQQQQQQSGSAATMSRLKNDDAPSDEEWYGRAGFHSKGRGKNLRLLGSNGYHLLPQQQPAQYLLQSQQPPHSQSQTGQRQPHLPHHGTISRRGTEFQQHRETNPVAHQDDLKNPSMATPKQGVSVMRPSYSDRNDGFDEMPHQKQSWSQSQSQHTQDYNQVHDQNQYRSQNHPTWQKMNQPYHNDNRRFYKRQMTSQQLCQEQQQQQLNGPNQGQDEQQHQTPHPRQQQDKDDLRRIPPREPSSISTLSLVDHLGNRTDYIQRTNKFMPLAPSKSLSVSPPMGKQDCRPLNVAANNYSDPLNEEGICPVSNQAHKFNENVQGQVSRGRNRQPVLQQQQQQDEDTVSVASIRKVWVEKTNILMEQEQQQALRLAQQRRREQKKSIEDRWMSNRRSKIVKSVPPPETRDYTPEHHDLEAQGYQSDGELQCNSRSIYGGNHQSQDLDAITPKDARNRLWDEQERLRQKKSIDDRWMNNRRSNIVKSVPPPETRDYTPEQHDLKAQGYQSEGEVQSNSRSRYDGDYQLQDLDAITPKDARNRLWDEQERLRAVLPKNETFKFNNVQGRWLEHRTEREHSNNDPSSPSQFSGGLASPGNHSGSSLNAGGRFKSKFVHAAALATHQRIVNTENDDMHRPNQSQESPWHHQHQQQLYDDSQHRHQSSGRQQQQPTTKTNYSQKSIAVLSHYTDSTAETTADFTTTPEGSNGSSPNRGMLRNNSSRMSENLVAQRVTPSPPNRYSKTHYLHSSLVMPPIDEQGVPCSLQNQPITTSVADLIARINAVSRFNPEEALAEIDFIIKKEGGGYGIDRRNVGGGRRSGICEPNMAPQEVPRSGPAPVAAPAPSKIARNNRPLGQGRHSGKGFFPDDEVQCIDREKIARGVADPRLSDEDHGGQDDDDDNSLSSDDSTVSSMTNPTYQSIPSQKVSREKASLSTCMNANPTPSTISSITEPAYSPFPPKPSKTVTSTTSQEPIKSAGDHGFLQRSSQGQQLKPLHTSWNTALKSSPPEENESSIKFSPDIESHDHHTQQQRQQPMPRNSTPTNARVPRPQQRGTLEKNNAERRNAVGHRNEERKQFPFTHPIPTGPSNTGDNSTARDQRTNKEELSHSQKGYLDNMNTKPKTIDFPEIMMVVSDAFADVDINLEAATTTTTDPSTSLNRSRPKVPVLQSFESKGGTVEDPLPTFHHRQPSSAACSASLQETISEAFSNVDIGFGQEKTVSERRKQLEYLSQSWVDDKNSRVHESSKARLAFVASKNKPEEKKSKLTGVPAIRLKGNKNLAQKFARLVNAFE